MELQAKLDELKRKEKEVVQYLDEAEGNFGTDDIDYLYSLRHQIRKIEAQIQH